MTEGPVGGAGELTALSEGEIRTIIYDALKNQFPAEGAAIMVAGCCAKPVLDALNKALAAKASQGVPPVEAEAVNSTKGNNLVGFNVKVFGVDFGFHGSETPLGRVLAASKLPVPPPVSDDTIHHGMVPPATVFKTTVLGVGPWCVEFPDGEIISTRSEARARLIAEREAAAPKPAPPSDEQVRKEFYDREYQAQEMATPAPLTPDADAIEAPSTEDAPLLQMKPVRRSLAEKAKDEMSEFKKGFPYDGATPAPGAEMPVLKQGDEVWVRGKVVDPGPLSSGAIVVAMSDSSGDDDGVVFVRPEDVTVREALAAAPPAPSDAIMREKEITVANHIREAANDGCQCEPCVAARHASAERVRELELTLKNLTIRMGAQINIIIERSNRQRGSVRNRTRRYAGTMENWLRMAREALPPSTGEKP